MRRLKGLGLGLVIVGAVVSAGLAASSAFADSPAVGVGSGSAGVQERATVELQDQDEGTRVVYQIVGEDEADIKSGRISITSPIARALVAKSRGDVVDVAAPGGTRTYEIVTVRLE